MRLETRERTVEVEGIATPELRCYLDGKHVASIICNPRDDIWYLWRVRGKSTEALLARYAERERAIAGARRIVPSDVRAPKRASDAFVEDDLEPEQLPA